VLGPSRHCGVLLLAAMACSPPAAGPPDPVVSVAPAVSTPALPMAAQSTDSAATALPPAPEPLLPANPAKLVPAIACDGPADTQQVTSTLARWGDAFTGLQLVIEMQPGGSCALPDVASVDAAFLVIEGTTSATVTGGQQPFPLGAWDALLVPGLGVRFETRTTGLTLVAAFGSRRKKGLASSFAVAEPWKVRPAAVAQASLSTAETLRWGNDAFVAKIAFGAPESPHVSLEVLGIAPGAAIPEHEHAEMESLWVLAGGGTLRLGEKEGKLDAGRYAAIPAKTKHAFSNSAARTVVVQSYAPAGAEQRFRKLSAEAAAPKP
jgi:quercetin dioxygenase-like cupin family protein